MPTGSDERYLNNRAEYIAVIGSGTGASHLVPETRLSQAEQCLAIHRQLPFYLRIQDFL